MGVSNKLERVLSGPAPDACQVFARHKIDLKEISGSALKQTVQPVVGCRVRLQLARKDVDGGAKEKLKQAQLQVGTV